MSTVSVYKQVFKFEPEMTRSIRSVRSGIGDFIPLRRRLPESRAIRAASQLSRRAASSFIASSSIECAAIGFHARNKLYRTPRIAAFIVDGL